MKEYEEKKYPLEDDIGEIALRWIAPPENPELEIVNCAKVSYANQAEQMGEREAKLLRFLDEAGHVSPSYHPHISFRVKCPIFVAREYFRHEVGMSKNEISQRYLELGKKFPLQFYVPEKFRAQSKHNKQASNGAIQEQEAAKNAYVYLLQQAAQTYEYMIKLGTSRELARMALPLSTYTEFISTGSFAAFKHFIDLRMHPDAQQEIGKYAIAIYDMLLPHFPISLEKFKDRREQMEKIYAGS